MANPPSRDASHRPRHDAPPSYVTNGRPGGPNKSVTRGHADVARRSDSRTPAGGGRSVRAVDRGATSTAGPSRACAGRPIAGRPIAVAAEVPVVTVQIRLRRPSACTVVRIHRTGPAGGG